MTTNRKNNERFALLSERILHTIWRSNPVEATALGIHDYDHTLGDMSEASCESHATALRISIKALENEVDPNLLGADGMIDYRVALSLAKSNALVLDTLRPWAKNPCLYTSQALWGCFGLLIRDGSSFVDNAENVLSRMLEIPEMLAESKINLIQPTSVFVQVGMDIVQAGLGFFRHSMPEVAAQIPALEKDLLKANEAAIASFESYGHWLEQTALPHSDDGFSIGLTAYEELLTSEHCLPYSAADIMQMGRDEVAETEDKIREVAGRIDPSMTWQKLVARLKQEHPSSAELKESYNQAFRDARDFVARENLVTIPEDERLDVKDTPSFERSIMPYAGYFPPAPFGEDRIGTFWVTPVNPDASSERQEDQLLGHCSYGIPVIALHEAYPGHHLQLARAHNVDSRVRKQSMSNLFIEGWALYCEEMMYERGFYTDPKVRLFQLKTTLWRACRVLIDVGLQTGQMSFDEAVRMLVDKALLELVNAEAEVKRYTMTPTQPMTYVIGKHLILNLRDRMQRKLGSRFDLRTFHDQLLSYGSIPPPLIADHMLSDASTAVEAQSLRLTA